MPLYKVTQTRSFREWFVVEAEDESEATAGTATELWGASEMGATSDLESESVEPITPDDLAALESGRHLP